MLTATDETVTTIASKQEARAKLREGFLKAVNELKDEPCKILTYEKSSLQAKFGGWHPDGNEILVQDLQTPACVKMSCALLRAPDILAIQFENHLVLP